VYSDAEDMTLPEFRTHIALCHPLILKHCTEEIRAAFPEVIARFPAVIAIAHQADHAITPRSHIHEQRKAEQ
jgi:hypothetical protein